MWVEREVQRELGIVFVDNICQLQITSTGRRIMESAYVWVDRALSNLGRNDYQSAMADCTSAIELRPDFLVA